MRATGTTSVRILAALLIVRAVACPLAESRDVAPGHARFVVRVCAWPAAEGRAGRIAIESRRDEAPPEGLDAPFPARPVPPPSRDVAVDGPRFAFPVPLRC